MAIISQSYFFSQSRNSILRLKELRLAALQFLVEALIEQSAVCAWTETASEVQ
jgi:hypothetical protein